VPSYKFNITDATYKDPWIVCQATSLI